MKSIIAELYHGNINPSCKTFERNSKYGETMKIITDSEEKLLKQLDDENLNLLKDFSDAQLNLNSITSVESFTDGFKLGVRLIVEALDGSENPNLKDLIKLD